MCSFSASPLPTPSVKPPPVSSDEVTVACATIAGCRRSSGLVTAVVMGSEVTCEIAPIIDHTNPLCPCSSSQVEVVGYPQGVKAGFLRQLGLADEHLGPVLFRCQEVAIAGHGSSPSALGQTPGLP